MTSVPFLCYSSNIIWRMLFVEHNAYIIMHIVLSYPILSYLDKSNQTIVNLIIVIILWEGVRGREREGKAFLPALDSSRMELAGGVHFNLHSALRCPALPCPGGGVLGVISNGSWNNAEACSGLELRIESMTHGPWFAGASWVGSGQRGHLVSGTVTSPGSGIWFRVPSDDYMRKRGRKFKWDEIKKNLVIFFRHE